MPIPLTQEQQNDYLMSRSVMDAPRAPYQQVMDMLFGRTFPEHFGSGLMGPLGSTQIAKISPSIVNTDPIRHALRAMGREALNYMRKTGQKILVAPRNIPGEVGSHTRLGKTHIVTLRTPVMESTAFHEIPGHVFEESLPYQAARDFLDAQEILPQKVKHLRLRSKYPSEEVPGEAFANIKDSQAPFSSIVVSGDAQSYANQISRAARKDLLDLMRKSATGE